MKPGRCNLCGGTKLTEIVSLGKLPIAHRFLKPNDYSAEYRHELGAHFCESCGLIQIVHPIDPTELYRDYNYCFSAWKLQPQMPDEVALIKSAVADPKVLEIGCNDGSFLREMGHGGLKKLIGIEPNRESSSVARKTGAMVYTGFFGEEAAEKIVRESGQVDVVVSRHVVEHIPDLNGLMRGVSKVMRNDGWLLFEVPDCEGPLRDGDCTGIWEEHINYFTEPVMLEMLRRYGFKAEVVRRYSFSGGALMVFARRTGSSPDGTEMDQRALKSIREVALAYQGRIEVFRKRLIALLQENRAKGVPNLLYGAGCRTNTIVNALNLKDYFEFIVDDQPEKHGMLLAGCRLEIRPAEALYEKVGCCFLSVNYENEERVIERHARYEKMGGVFRSLLSPSPLRKLI